MELAFIFWFADRHHLDVRDVIERYGRAGMQVWMGWHMWRQAAEEAEAKRRAPRG